MSTFTLNLPSMDMTKRENIESAKKAEGSTGGVSGKYEIEVVQASLSQSKNGSTFLTLAFKMPNGKVYRQKDMHIAHPDGREGFFVPRLRTLFGVSGASDTVGTATIKEGDFIDGNYIEREVEVPSYVDLLGKKVGAVLRFYQEYPESYGINGYTGHRIPSKAENPAGYEMARQDPTTIWMPNYEKETQPVFEFMSFYDVATEKTYAEMLDDNLEKPVALAQAVEKVMARDHRAVVLQGKKWDELRVKKLKYNLKRANMEYDKSMFIPSDDNDSPAVDDVDLP